MLSEAKPEYSCPLCQGDLVRPVVCAGDDRRYFRCGNCDLISVAAGDRLSAAAEKAEYDLHQNSPQDLGYRRFLSRLAAPLLDRLAPASEGLDFGCGPGPTLSVMLTEAGHRVALYDRFYAHHPEVFEATYDFITATEVVEHLHQPQAELDRLWGCLRSGGTLGLMTKLARDDAAFARWHYKSDPTHICFFSVDTFQWLATQWGAGLTLLGQDVILLHKPDRR